LAGVPGLSTCRLAPDFATREVAADAYRSATGHATVKRRGLAIYRRNIAAFPGAGA